jgi:beta-RFAP synthase
MNQSSQTLEVRTPNRLHFGLLSFGDPTSPHQFGGVGAMIASPGVHLRHSPAPRFTVIGRHAERVERFARRVAKHYNWPVLPPCQIEVLSAPRQHVGLGVGTQLGMAVAASLASSPEGVPLDIPRLAQAAGRGKRSSIGIHGFRQGGFIIDSGYNEEGQLGGVEAHCNLPADWRFVLAIDTRQAGLAHSAERRAFASVPPVPPAVTAELRQIALEGLYPAARDADHARFSDSLYEYGAKAGGCFATVQGGPFASRAIAERVELIRSLGFSGCGQSSWGPTIFSLTPSPNAAAELLEQLQTHDAMQGCELLIAEPDNRGAKVRRLES